MSLFRSRSIYETKPASPFTLFAFFGILAAISLFFGISGFLGESRTLDSAFDTGYDLGSVVSGTPAYGAPEANLDYKHSVSSIPIGHEYYYMILSEDQDNILLVRADKDFGSNFDSESFENITGVSVKGKVRKASQKVSRNFSELATIMEPDVMYIDTIYRSRSIKWLIIAAYNILMIILLIVHYCINGMGARPSGAFGAVIGGLTITGFIGCGYLLLYNILLN